MSKASNTLPENRYEPIVMEESEGFPAPGDRVFEEGNYKGRSVGFVPYGRELLGRDFLVAHEEGTSEIAAQDRMMGVLSRETPTMTMASVYARFLDWAHNLARIEKDPGVRPQNLLLVLSGPGVGKTHLPSVIAKAFGYAHELIGSGEAGGDIDELVIAHEFKGNSAGDIFKKVEAELSTELEQESATQVMLKAKLKEAGFLEEYLDERGVTQHRLNLSEIMQTQSDGAERSGEQDKKMQANIEQVWKIAHECHLDVKDGSTGIGVQKVNGRLLTKLLEVKAQYERSGKAEPVIITLDEFNRFKSFGKKLQNFWEVVSGTRNEPVKLTDAAGVTHTFTPDMMRYVYVYLTGNDPSKMMGNARELDYSMLDRIGEQRIFRLDDFSVADWQHRLEQQLTGIGIDMHYRAGADADGTNIWNDDPADFTRHLLAKREQGCTPKEKLELTRMQRDLLENWDNVHQGTGQVAQFFADWKNTYKQHKSSEEWREMASKPEITARLMIHLVNDLRSTKLGASSARANRLAKAQGKPIAQPDLTSANLGSRLSATIKDMVDKTHPKRDSVLRQDLYKAMYKNGIISKEVMVTQGYDISEMLASGGAEKLVADLLNCDPNKQYDKELKPLQEAVAEVIRQRYPDYRDKSDNELVTLGQLSEAIKTARQQERELLDAGRPSDMPPVLRRFFIPEVTLSETDGKVHFTLAPRVVLDDLTHPEQLPAATRETVLKNLLEHIGGPESYGTTLEVLLGLAMTQDTSAALTELYNPHFTVHTNHIVSRQQLITAQTNLEKEPNSATKQTLVTKTEKSLARATEQLNPDYNGEYEFADSTRGTHEMSSGSHPSGIRTTIVGTGYNAAVRTQKKHNKNAAASDGSQIYSDTLTVVSVSRPDPEDAEKQISEVLIVGFTPIPEGLKSFLKERRHVTYVNAREESACEEITSSLREIVGIGRAQLQAKAPNHTDINETDKTGIMFRLGHILKHRLPSNQKPSHLVQAAGNGQEVDVLEQKIQRLALHMMEPSGLSAIYNSVQHITKASWQDLVSNSSPTPGAGRAA